MMEWIAYAPSPPACTNMVLSKPTTPWHLCLFGVFSLRIFLAPYQMEFRVILRGLWRDRRHVSWA